MNYGGLKSPGYRLAELDGDYPDLCRQCGSPDLATRRLGRGIYQLYVCEECWEGQWE